MNEAYNVGFKDGASAGYKLAIEDMKLDKKPQIMKKYEGDYAALLARHNALRHNTKVIIKAYRENRKELDALKEAARQVLEEWLHIRPQNRDNWGCELVLSTARLDALAALVGEG